MRWSKRGSLRTTPCSKGEEIHRGSFRSTRELEQAIRAFPTLRNDQSKDSGEAVKRTWFAISLA
jgi:hypothetical protein